MNVVNPLKPNVPKYPESYIYIECRSRTLSASAQNDRHVGPAECSAAARARADCATATAEWAGATAGARHAIARALARCRQMERDWVDCSSFSAGESPVIRAAHLEISCNVWRASELQLPPEASIIIGMKSIPWSRQWASVSTRLGFFTNVFSQLKTSFKNLFSGLVLKTGF